MKILLSSLTPHISTDGTMVQVYQFMTQKDAKTNITLVGSSAAIAKAAKADSSAMKTIAILGMFFLPSAFIAVRSTSTLPLTFSSASADSSMPKGHLRNARHRLGRKRSTESKASIQILLGRHRTTYPLNLPILGTGDAPSLASMDTQVQRKQKQTDERRHRTTVSLSQHGVREKRDRGLSP